jgi:pyruvate/2-oxoglutarate dehydrogenase complex dihydrolipoamide acyltransferase (E2) component
MREKLNENPLAQIAVIGVLLALGILLLTSLGGGESASDAEAEAPTAVSGASSITPAAEPAASPEAAAASPEAAAAPAISPPAAPPTPKAVTAAWKSDRTVVLLFVREGGIDDRMVRAASLTLASVSGVELFVVPARRIATYASITEGVGVNRVPALIVLRPKSLGHGTVTASVNYGYQAPQSIRQDVVDARYRGRTLSYHP